ncbi:MAG: septum site-determining protein MinC [Burkholderiaceae bacterium]|jgi:septum site-determining protein MinC|nr:septum site-determining protein MinC [Burkholderiaceae bacterium]
MSIALTGRSLVTFEIKSARLSLLTLRLKSADLDAFAAELQTHYGDVPDFFANDLLVIDLSYLSSDVAALDFERLKTLLMNHRLRPIAVAGGSSELLAAALVAGLPSASEWEGAQQSQDSLPQQQPGDQQSDSLSVPGALVIDKPLRSGQRVYARGRDLVLLALCNPGAEAIADGHIHVYAPLRGRAIAGARGWSEARVFALNMQPELISIAGVYLTSEQGSTSEIWGHPAVAHLAATEASDKLIFEPLT